MNWKALQQGLVIFLLFCIVLIQGIQVGREYLADKNCQSVVSSYQGVIKAQKDVYLGLMDTYKNAAYHDASIERIAEQQLIASESQLAALQVMASQNGVLVEILSVCK